MAVILPDGRRYMQAISLPSLGGRDSGALDPRDSLRSSRGLVGLRSDRMSYRMRVGVLVGLVVLAVGALFVIPPVEQPTWYHLFADQRCLLCVPHMMNVVSNLGFLVVGVLGMV